MPKPTTKKPVRRGRKGDRTPQVRAALIKALKAGATKRLACQYAGISETMFYRWLGEDEDFQMEVEQASSRCAVDALEKIVGAANAGTWQAAAWMLERRWPHDYGRQVREVEGTLGVVELPPVEKTEWLPPSE